MPHPPLITVITPCFNDGATLPMALASLVAQTVEDWECIVVDDGSGRSVAPIVEAFGERRIELLTFGRNRGRSVARQRALERARGDYICMLDADDWYYPEKLERQLAVMDEHRRLAAVSSGLAVMDGDDQLVGMRSHNPSKLEIHIGEKARFPGLPFPSVMLRRSVALAESFDPRLQRSEDLEYLMRVLEGRRYGVMAESLYAYREVFSDESMGEALSGFRNQRKVFGGQIGEAPLRAGRQYLWSLVKSGIYGAARATARGRWLFARRNRAPTAEERRAFAVSRSKVRRSLEEITGLR